MSSRFIFFFFYIKNKKGKTKTPGLIRSIDLRDILQGLQALTRDERPMSTQVNMEPSLKQVLLRFADETNLSLISY